MSLSLTDAQLTLLRLAKRHLALPARDEEVASLRNELALLANLELVEPHEGGFRLTSNGVEVLHRLDATRPAERLK